MAWWCWPAGGSGFDPNAHARPVTARGELAGLEQTNIAIYEAAAVMVHVTKRAAEPGRAADPQGHRLGVPPFMSLRELVEGYVYHYHRKTFPVVSDGTLVGYVETDALARFPRSEWEFRTVGEVMHNDPAPVAIRSDADALDALKRMQQTGSGRLFADDGRLVGILSLKDLLRFLTLKLEVEHATEGGAAAAAG